MNKLHLSVLYIIDGLITGISLGWLAHFSVVPKPYLIIAGAILLISIIVSLSVIKNGGVRGRVAQVPVIICSIAVFLLIFTSFTSQIFFTSINWIQIIIYVLTALIIAMNNYSFMQRLMKK